MSGTHERPRRTSRSTGSRSRRPQPYFSTPWPLPLAIRITPAGNHERSRSVILESSGSPSSRIVSAANESESSAQERRHEKSGSNMKKASTKRNDELRPEYDLSKLKGGMRGKYYRAASAGTNLVLIEPDLAAIFPDSESVNQALRALAAAAKATSPPRKRKESLNRRA